mmetsp:Transcript_20763/g.67252  ORF Transcript_20763/g.67252 Transcript_20763/m.67252 type:complete len:321 (+) Transcript_20763:191-1153(+)
MVGPEGVSPSGEAASASRARDGAPAPLARALMPLSVTAGEPSRMSSSRARKNPFLPASSSTASDRRMHAVSCNASSAGAASASIRTPASLTVAPSSRSSRRRSPGPPASAPTSASVGCAPRTRRASNTRRSGRDATISTPVEVMPDPATRTSERCGQSRTSACASVSETRESPHTSTHVSSGRSASTDATASSSSPCAPSSKTSAPKQLSRRLRPSLLAGTSSGSNSRVGAIAPSHSCLSLGHLLAIVLRFPALTPLAPSASASSGSGDPSRASHCPVGPPSVERSSPSIPARAPPAPASPLRSSLVRRSPRSESVACAS